MVGLAESETCRRRVLLNYFGERREQDCGNCDVCLDPPERFDATEAARMALSCVYRVGQRFGIAHVIDVLRGADTERIRTVGHRRLSTWGIGRDRSQVEWISILRQLIHRGYLVQDIAAYSVLKLTEAARPLLRGEELLQLARPRVREQVKKKRSPRAAPAAESPDQALFAALRALRKRLADAQGVPPYVIFGDVTLSQMASIRPVDEAALLEITGVGRHKLGKYGAAFLDAIAVHRRTPEGVAGGNAVAPD
jgi:ATP-dependent DNA helicase RecQ